MMVCSKNIIICCCCCSISCKLLKVHWFWSLLLKMTLFWFFKNLKVQILLGFWVRLFQDDCWLICPAKFIFNLILCSPVLTKASFTFWPLDGLIHSIICCLCFPIMLIFLAILASQTDFVKIEKSFSFKMGCARSIFRSFFCIFQKFQCL